VNGQDWMRGRTVRDVEAVEGRESPHSVWKRSPLPGLRSLVLAVPVLTAGVVGLDVVLRVVGA
jgi:hypothetical protein